MPAYFPVLALRVAVVKLPTVDHLGGLLRPWIVLVCDLQLVYGLHRRHLPISGRLDQGYEFDISQVLGDAILGQVLVV